MRSIRSPGHRPARLACGAFALALGACTSPSTGPGSADSQDGQVSLVNAGNGYDWPDFHDVYGSKSGVPSLGTPFVNHANDVSYGSTPNFGSTLIGRTTNKSENCPSTLPIPSGKTHPFYGESLTVTRMSWLAEEGAAPGPVFQSNLLDTSVPVEIAPATSTFPATWLDSAYDATVTPYRGEYWVAFECGGFYAATAASQCDLPPRFGSAGSCVGPIAWDGTKMALDGKRISQVVRPDVPVDSLGVPKPSSMGTETVSASVPKIFVFQGHVYLYWDAGKNEVGVRRNDFLDPTRGFHGSDERGAELVVDPATGKMFVARQDGKSLGPVVTDDPVLTSLVMRDIDLFQVVPYRRVLLALGGLKVPTQTDGGAPDTRFEYTCAKPSNNVRNCYREVFAQAIVPLPPTVGSYPDGVFTIAPAEQAALQDPQPTGQSRSYRPNDGSSCTAATPCLGGTGSTGVDRITSGGDGVALVEEESVGNTKAQASTITFSVEAATGFLAVSRGSGSNKVRVWPAAGTLALRSDCQGDCYVTFARDGNLWLNKQDEAKPYWTSQTGASSVNPGLGTDPQPGARLVLSPTPPHLQIFDAADELLWASSASEGVGSDGVPNTSESYDRWVYRPEGALGAGSPAATVLMGGQDTNVIAVGEKTGYHDQVDSPTIRVWPRPLILFPVCDPETQPYPTFAQADNLCYRNGIVPISHGDLELDSSHGASSPAQVIGPAGSFLRFESGVLSMVNAAGKAVWRVGSTADCPDTCSAVFQSDGNLVLETPQGVYWQTGATGATSLFLSASAPYVELRDVGGSIEWASSYTFPLGFELLARQLVQLRDAEGTPTAYLELNAAGVLATYAGAHGTSPIHALWSTTLASSSPLPSSVLKFQKADGNLVLYETPSTVLWKSGTSSTTLGGAHTAALALSSLPPYVSLLDDAGNTWWSAVHAFAPTLVITPGEFIQQGLGEQGPGGTSEPQAYLTMDDTGAVLLYRGVFGKPHGTAAWSVPEPSGAGPFEVRFQADGNLVAYDDAKPYWSTKTYGTTADTTVPTLVFATAGPSFAIDRGTTQLWSSQN